MIRICPSILNANFDALPEEIAKVAEVADFLHLDVMDDVFVPNFTFDLARSLEIIEFSQLPVDVHLMIAEVDAKATNYAIDNTAGITVHYEACADPIETLKQIRISGKRAGLAIKPNTPFDAVSELAPYFDMLLVMTVEPGFGGQSFMESMMPKVSQARTWLHQKGYSDRWIQVDGGISIATIRTAYSAGADTFVAGSAVYRSEDPAAMISALREAAAAN
ncbi:MAG: ribulose-phosphate 3-epimerase [Actinobacteria bacterium]|jgi:ribulose-phosphate 3-epimerase|nr:ribulose-phosphate 3-epimerase [Actinomycetota bacterium]NDE53719.1 ribulose-phosphate 3-epimerase [Actinomycetota bacterium]